MPKSDAKKSDAKKSEVLKGQAAEDAVLTYVQQMNRPYGAADVAANLKGAVPKTQVAKILAALAEKGSLVAKAYGSPTPFRLNSIYPSLTGKTTFYVANQANISVIPAEQLAALEQEAKDIEEEIKILGMQVKASTSELAKVKATPTDDQVDAETLQLTQVIQKTDAQLQPFRSGAPLISEQEIEQVDAYWMKWKVEWVSRKKVYKDLYNIVADAMSKQDANALEEDLGVEQDTHEHVALERGLLVATTNLKRKR
ncbi:TBPIP-domain-containing protein [Mycena amicta]|nr:TBPIP-domain-containing protein [Mycena amicta]